MRFRAGRWSTAIHHFSDPSFNIAGPIRLVKFDTIEFILLDQFPLGEPDRDRLGFAVASVIGSGVSIAPLVVKGTRMNAR